MEAPDGAQAGGSVEFRNTPDTDPSLAGNRAWGKEIISKIATSSLGNQLAVEHTVTSVTVVESILQTARAAGTAWGAKPASERAAILRAAAVEFEKHRAEFLEVAGSECGKTLDQSDPEVSEAIDFLNYYAELAESLHSVDGATHVPVKLTLVTPPWNFPLAIPTGGMAAALAAGSAVVIKPAPQAKRCGSLLVETLWAAGVPKDALHLAHVPEDEAGKALVSSPLVDRLILTGAFDTAQLFRSFRPDLPLLAETSGKNAIVITPNADLDLAVKDLVYSAFGHAGQKCSAASLGVLVGTIATSNRFHEQLIDAVSSVKVGYPGDPTAQVGPLIEPASGKLLQALTRLAPGESWLVEPQKLDDSGRLWSPGVKTGVKRGSEYHLSEYFGPVLGLITADTLEEAIEIQNQVDYGLTVSLHSLDRAEVETWIDSVQVSRQRCTSKPHHRRRGRHAVSWLPFGGWKKSAVGAGTKAGGPNYLIGLSDWTSSPATRFGTPVEAAQAIIAGAASLRTLDDIGLISPRRHAARTPRPGLTNSASHATSVPSAQRKTFCTLPPSHSHHPGSRSIWLVRHAPRSYGSLPPV